MEFLTFFISPLAKDVMFKLLIAFILSSIIGIERELVHKPAGIKTHTLICLSATLVMALGMYMRDLFPNVTLDPTRLPAQILAGIGFVGAGTIIREGLSVKGITTAASLLAITCVGLSVGAGFYEGAIFATIFMFLILCFASPVKSIFEGKGKMILFSVISSRERGVLSEVQNIFENKNADVVSIRQHKSNSSNAIILKFLVKCNMDDMNDLIQELNTIEGIKEINTTKKINKADVE